jgi:hypothetical protein
MKSGGWREGEGSFKKNFMGVWNNPNLIFLKIPPPTRIR